ncbi:tetratricopeptide repeat protein [Tenacibaculum sp. UWU-22]|uniref:tetratricopeptide repeat protein n=1 Tax=Tenacibaculum sp. UWU-22 TaxID=3234187 RepID=UPI0034DB763E
MIIQNLYNSLKSFKLKNSNKTICFVLLLFCVVYTNLAQDSIPHTVSLSEKNNTAFQEYFFKALAEKGINHYQKAIENLEECNLLIPNNKAVLFELSKNYFYLHKNFEAILFANQALEKDPDNLWILTHLVAIYKDDKNYTDAIKIQQKIAAKHPKKKQELVLLYLQNEDYISAKKTLQELENAKLLTPRLRNIKNKLTKPAKALVIKEPLKQNHTDLVKQFENDKSFVVLQKLLTKLDTEKSPDLLKYSQQGVNLFPAQPLVYLMNGKALNNQKQYKKAIEALQNGIDFVIENPQMQNLFYVEMANAYEGLGNPKEAEKYRRKVKK